MQFVFATCSIHRISRVRACQRIRGIILAQLNRRSFLRASAAASVLAVAAGTGLLRPMRVWAATWPSGAFTANNVSDVLQKLYGSDKSSASKDIKITANLQAENGASVPVAVRASMPNVESVSILIHENAMPLAAHIRTAEGAAGYLRANIKMLKTSRVEFVVKAGGKLYSDSRKIKVTRGGCGG